MDLTQLWTPWPGDGLTQQLRQSTGEVSSIHLHDLFKERHPQIQFVGVQSQSSQVMVYPRTFQVRWFWDTPNLLQEATYKDLV